MKKLIIVFFLFCFHNKISAQTFTPLGQGFDLFVRSLCADTINNLIYAGGNFSQLGNGISMSHISKWDGITWDSLGSGTDGHAVYAVEMYQGNLYAGGGFNYMNGIQAMGIAKWTGINWQNTGNITQNGFGGVNGLKVINNVLYVMGKFDSIDGIPFNKIVQWNGISWSPFAVLDSQGGGFGIYVTEDYNNEQYVGGNFNSQIAPVMNDIAKWDGSTWSPVGNGLSGFMTSISAMVVYQSELYIGGWFKLAYGDPGDFIAKWDGSTWSQVSNGLNGPAYAFQIFNNELYVGGSFSTAGGISVNNIAKWNGLQWQSIPNATFNNAINCFTVLNNQLYIGGAFTTVSGIIANRIVKYTAPVGFKENKNKNERMHIYPNPFTEKFKVTGIKLKAGEKTDIIIYNLIGETVYEKELLLNKTEEELNLSLLQQGVYFLNLKSNKESFTKKIVKL